MAVFPCDWSAHRYPGPQRSIYVTFAFGDTVTTSKLRLCQQHFDLELEQIQKAMAEVDDSSQYSITCERCPKDRGETIFAKVFNSHAEPVTYAVDVCHGCAADLAGMLKVANGRPMADRPALG
jgi:hypothetical protein